MYTTHAEYCTFSVSLFPFFSFLYFSQHWTESSNYIQTYYFAIELRFYFCFCVKQFKFLEEILQ
jgi:hypothetical protein